MEALKEFFAKVDFLEVRTAPPPELVFLCGGTNQQPNDDYFRPKLQTRLKELERNVVLAENAMDWQGGQGFAKDLLELEKYYAALVSVIPLVCESYGSVAELGSFINDESIKNKLFIIVKEQYYTGDKSNSFIRHGPIKNYEDTVGKDGNGIFTISDTNPENDLDDLCEELLEHRPSTHKCDFKKGYFQILLLIDIINALVISHEREVKEHLNQALKIILGEEFEPELRDIKEMLFVLKKLDLIKVRTKGSKKYYLSKKRSLFLEYKAQTPSNYKKITTVRKFIENSIFQNKTKENRKKINIWKEEVRAGEIEWLRRDVELSEDDIARLLRTAPLQYKVFKIPKKGSREKRTIAQPTPKLKELQRLKVSELEHTLPIHSAATAYRKNKNGILENAKVHKDSKYFVKLDFSNFFNSIKAADFAKFLEGKSFSLPDIIDYLKIFFMFDKASDKRKTRNIYSVFLNESFNSRDNPNFLKVMTEQFREEFQLSVGAPSSPFVSNAIMYEFDEKIKNWAEEKNLCYSRYADDLVFSSEKLIDLDAIKQKIVSTTSEIEYLNLDINDEKTKKASFKGRVTITGLNITPENKVSIGRKKKKELRAMMHHYKERKLSREDRNSLRGWIAYCKAVEPEFVRSLEAKYTPELVAEVLGRK